LQCTTLGRSPTARCLRLRGTEEESPARSISVVVRTHFRLLMPILAFHYTFPFHRDVMPDVLLV
jgi:hypothetical protein